MKKKSSEKRVNESKKRKGNWIGEAMRIIRKRYFK